MSSSPGRSSSPSPASQAGKRPAEEATASGRAKAQKQDPLVFKGRHLARAYACWTWPSVIGAEGIQRLSLDETNDAPPDYNIEQERNYAAFQWAFESDPKMLQLYLEDADEAKRMNASLKAGQRKARSDDTRILRVNAMDWITWPKDNLDIPRPSSKSKHERGFNNPLLLELLAPVDLELNEVNRLALKAGTAQMGPDEDGKFHRINGSEWMCFQYEGEYDREDPLKGLYKGELLVKAFKCIFTSPSSVDGDAGATRSGNATLHNMNKVTPASLAYINAQLYFALSSQNTFSPSTTGVDIGGVYNTVLTLFESRSPAIQAYSKDLLAWWDKVIFPSAISTSGPDGKGSLARLEAKLMRSTADH